MLLFQSHILTYSWPKYFSASLLCILAVTRIQKELCFGVILHIQSKFLELRNRLVIRVFSRSTFIVEITFEISGYCHYSRLTYFVALPMFVTKLGKLFSKNRSHNRSTRNSLIFQYPKHRTIFFEATSIFLHIPIQWLT